MLVWAYDLLWGLLYALWGFSFFAERVGVVGVGKKCKHQHQHQHTKSRLGLEALHYFQHLSGLDAMRNKVVLWCQKLHGFKYTLQTQLPFASKGNPPDSRW